MRHDPASGAIIIMLRSLKMHGMAQAVTDLIEQGAPAFEAAVPVLTQLLKAEMAEREVRSIAYHMKAARFPAYKDLSGFDFSSSEMNEATVRQLHRCEFMEGAQNIVLIGGPGTGKLRRIVDGSNGDGQGAGVSQGAISDRVVDGIRTIEICCRGIGITATAITGQYQGTALGRSESPRCHT